MLPLRYSRSAHGAFACFAFVAGLAFDHFLLGPNHTATLAFEKPPEGVEDKIRLLQASVAETSSPQNTLDVVREKDEREDWSDDVLSRLFDPAEEARIEHSVKRPLPVAGTRVESLQVDGSIDEYFSARDETNSFRQRNPQGEILKDGWTDAKGDNYFRTFYRAGGPKLVSISRSDGGQTTVTFDENGNRETFFEKRSDDESVSVNYDSRGDVREVWHIYRDGRSELVYPEP